MPTLADQGVRPDAFAAWLTRMRAAVDACLVRAIPAATPPVLDAALRYALLGGGKRVRPLLALATADAILGSEPETLRLAMPAACALELIHTYSLVHDDLPAMDDDDLRRGRPTTHIRFGQGQAILVGDGLLTEAFAWLAREPDDAHPAIVARKLQTIGVIASAAGAAGMVGGQALDLDAARPHDGAPRPTFDAAALADMHARKTGALIEAAAVAGATMAGAD
ncbi:MAG TPA: polyprenyl synthetase family protein, partial [Vicinamibacterales bacterium]|nr:polyprenyl synthetase family protein [Vicinamibacterales bacterium]